MIEITFEEYQIIVLILIILFSIFLSLIQKFDWVSS